VVKVSSDYVQRLVRVAPPITLLLLFAVRAVSATTASDTAANQAYSADATGAWKGLNSTTGENPPGTDNGGFGFQTWNFAGGFQQPQYSPYGDLNHFIDGVDFSPSSFDNLGAPSFGLTNSNFDSGSCHLPSSCPFGGETSRATRVLSQPLAMGSTVSMQFDNPSALTPSLPLQDRWFPAGILMRFNSGGGPAISGSTGVKRFELFTSTGTYGDNTYATQWYVNDADSSVTGGQPVATGVQLTTTSSGAKLSFTLVSAESYSMQLTRVSDGSLLYSHSGNLESAGAGAIDTLEIALYGNGSGNGVVGASASPTGEREFFFNNLTVSSPGLTGDYNHNGVVDAADYVLWRDTLSQSVTAGTGADGNGDGMVTQTDYNIWRGQFGMTSGAGLSETTVPEPSVAFLVTESLVAALTITLSSRRIGDGNRSCVG
jgi:hypothetical protein